MMTEFSHGQPVVPRDEVSSVLGTMNNGDTELSRRLMDKVLLENADDVIHVLSLKGIFMPFKKKFNWVPMDYVSFPA